MDGGEESKYTLLCQVEKEREIQLSILLYQVVGGKTLLFALIFSSTSFWMHVDGY